MANILQLILHNVLAMLLQYYASGSVHNVSSCRSNVCEEVSKHNCCHTNTPDIVAIYPPELKILDIYMSSYFDSIKTKTKTYADGQ
jgi:hypothetical protein